MPLPVQRSETLEHDVNEREPERSTCPHVPSPTVTAVAALTHGLRMRIVRIAPNGQASVCLTRGPGQGRMSGPFVLHAFAPGL
jgi:hypothetical protein